MRGSSTGMEGAGRWRCSNRFFRRVRASSIAVFSILVAISAAQALENLIPKNQKPLLKVFPPATADQSKPGTGKFVIFTREQVGKDWDFIAGAWECIPSRPEIPVTKRVEFCHSSWNCGPLLNTLVSDDSQGMHPRFATLQVNSGDRGFAVNLYDINYRTWQVRCIWQGSRLSAFGKMGDSIFCSSTDGWLLVNSGSGEITKEVPFTPLYTDGDFWLVRKVGETDGCWSFDRRRGQYIAHFSEVDTSIVDFSRSKLSTDGKNRAWVLASAPKNWFGGALVGRLVLQRNSEKKDISIPIEMQAIPGSGRPVLPQDIELTFTKEGKLQFRAWQGGIIDEDAVWSIDIATGKVSSSVVPHSAPDADGRVVFDGVPVPDYLREKMSGLWHFGKGGFAPALLLHLGILKEKPEYPDCTVGVSPDGRHVLYRAKEGPLAGVFIYGDLLTQKTVRWELPDGFDSRCSQEFVWVETP